MRDCCLGCKVYAGGEIYHHKDCVHYPESFSQMYDVLKVRERMLTEIIETENKRRSDASMDPFQMN